MDEIIDKMSLETLEAIKYAEEEFQNKRIANYKYDRISNTLSIQLFPNVENTKINVTII
jgi:hypothetical protein